MSRLDTLGFGCGSAASNHSCSVMAAPHDFPRHRSTGQQPRTRGPSFSRVEGRGRPPVLRPQQRLDLWHVKKVNPQNMIHLTEKPVELATRAMEYSSRPGENVLDLFGGSGSTLIAAEKTGRRAFLMELDALYCDIIALRWEQMTGKKAERTASCDKQKPQKRRRQVGRATAA